jgi:GDP-fucose protein O-fucosyltransferase
MAMETLIGIAIATGRTLVLPPERKISMLNTAHDEVATDRSTFTFADFFNMEAIAREHKGLNIITTTQFLERHVMTGEVRSPKGRRLWPPNNITKWDGLDDKQEESLFRWLRRAGHLITWDSDTCIAAFPQSNNRNDVMRLIVAQKEMLKRNPTFENYVGKPVDINGSIVDRMCEMRAGRNGICLYDEIMQKMPLLHSSGIARPDTRLLVHFYAFLFFQNWKEDLWLKRFIRDHVRYTDEIQCAAARVVAAIRDRVRERGYADGMFDSAHVRRGDFLTMWYNVSTTSAENILKKFRLNIPVNTTVYIATDERDKSYFDPLREVYDVVFLNDFLHVVEGVNKNFYGMVDQLIASRGRTFYGCWFSTFTVSCLNAEVSMC